MTTRAPCGAKNVSNETKIDSRKQIKTWKSISEHRAKINASAIFTSGIKLTWRLLIVNI